MADNKRELQALRDRIDAIDQSLQDLLNQRAAMAQAVARVKLAEVQAQHGEALGQRQLDELVQFYRPEREAQILRRVIERNAGPMPADKMAWIFREIMSACLALEKPMQVAYLGPAGTFTQEATLKHFGHGVISQPVSTIDAVFRQVEHGEAHFGVVPVENSTEGMVNHTLDNFLNSALKISGEIELPIHLHLLVAPGVKPEAVRRICAHQQALAQCREWLARHWPNVETAAVSSNGEAARLAASEPGVAAIAGNIAASTYGLVRLADNIEDVASNTTRFLVIGRDTVQPSGKDKTSIIVSTRNEPGALFRLLEPFHREGIMLTRIDTRPSRTENWAYVFFMEFEGHQQDPVIGRILDELQGRTLMLKILGSYPRAVC